MSVVVETRASRLWLSLLVRGVLAIVVGVVALAWPGVTLNVLLMLFGLFTLVDGLVAVAAGLVVRRSAWGWVVFQGLVGVVIGLLALRFPQTAAAVVVIFFAAWALLAGLIEAYAALRFRRAGSEHWGWLLASAVLTLAFGLFFLINPLVGAQAVVVVVGFFAIVLGLVFTIGALRVRKLGMGSVLVVESHRY